MKNWQAYLLLIIAIYLFYNLIISLKKGEIVWKILKFNKVQNPTKFWITFVCQFILASLFLTIAILYIFFYEELLQFLIKIS